MIRRLIVALPALCLASHALAAMRYPVKALILNLDKTHLTFVASSAEIPGYMKAMVMPFRVKDARSLDSIKPGIFVDFTLVVDKEHSWVENVKVHEYQNLEAEPVRARRLQLIAQLDKANPPAPSLAAGDRVPDFTLIDQSGKRVSLSQFAGKVVGLTFIYTSCPLPDYCFRLSNNFGRVQKRFAARMGKDLILLSVSFDPVHDQPDVLARYAGIWKADPNSWHFLTGSLPDVKAVCHLFGLNFWADEASVTHTLHTIVIDRRGRMAANFEGNEFTAEQLGDFVETTLSRKDN